MKTFKVYNSQGQYLFLLTAKTEEEAITIAKRKLIHAPMVSSLNNIPEHANKFPSEYQKHFKSWKN